MMCTIVLMQHFISGSKVTRTAVGTFSVQLVLANSCAHWPQLYPPPRISLSCTQIERFLHLLKTNKREEIHEFQNKIARSLHKDHTTTSQWSNLFVIKSFLCDALSQTTTDPSCFWPCYDLGLLSPPSVLSCFSCNIIFVCACVYEIPSVVLTTM